MNPAEKGWLSNYIKFRAPHPVNLDQYDIKDSEKLLYKIIQPTGLIYGHPLHAPGIKHPKEQRWNSLSKMKVVLLESFLNSAIISQERKPSTEKAWGAYYMQTSLSIGRYYKDLNPRISKQWFFSFRKKEKIDLRFTEQLLHKRLFLKSHWDYFWASLFQNSLLFLDTYYFGEWVVGNFHSIKWHKDAMKILLLEVIAAAAHANHIIEREENSMFHSFLSSSNLNKAQKKIAKKALIKGITLDEIDLRHADTWLLKKYVLELAVLMIWADKVVTSTERVFLSDLANRLGFSEEELDSSLIAIEAFVIENWKEVYFLQSKHSYQVISETIIQRIKFTLNNHQDAIAKSIDSDQELKVLQKKSTIETLTSTEKELLRLQLISHIRAIPPLSLIELPHNFLTLSVLLKVIPKGLLPTSFLI